MKNGNKIYFRLLQVAVFFTFLGRAYQHWFYEAPYREILWDEHRMSGLVKVFFGMNWGEWVSNPTVDKGISHLIDGVGVFYLFCAIAVFFVKENPRFAAFFLKVGTIGLFILAALFWKQKLYATGQFFEYTLAFTAPVFLLWFVKEGELSKKMLLWMKTAIAFTFCSHAMYALNYYPQPLSFFEMTGNILGVEEAQTRSLLWIMGGGDILISILIFLPYRKIVMTALLYATIWGLLTAVARPWGYFHIEFWQDSLHQWGFEAMVRFVHGLVPLVLLLYYRKNIAH